MVDNNPNLPRDNFARLLNIVAGLTAVDLTTDVIAIYVAATENDPGHDNAIKGLLSLFPDMKPGRGFPSITDIRDACKAPGDRLSDEDVAREAAAKALGAVSKFGWPNGRQAREFMGELAWGAVDKMGGWAMLCETLTAQNMTTMQAQLRDLIGSIIARSKAGIVDQPLTALPGGFGQQKALVDSIVNEMVARTTSDHGKEPPSVKATTSQIDVPVSR